VVGGTVVVSDGLGVTGLNAADGGVLWSNDLMDEGFFLVSGLAAGGDLVVAADMDNRVVAFDAGSGAIRWTQAVPEGGPMGLEVAVVGETVVAYGDGGVAGMPLATGEPLWRAAVGYPVAVGAMGPHVAAADGVGELVLLDPATGESRGRVPAGPSTVAMTTLPGEQPLLVLAGPGTLRALTPEGGTAWEAEVPVEPFAVAAAPGFLTVTDFAGNVAGYRM
jgi:outer membrane protein assembly factor BamB